MTEVICRVCGTALPIRAGVACRSCRAPHHRDCWTYQGGCSIYGCGGEEAGPWEALAEDRSLPVLHLTSDDSPRVASAPLAAGALARRFRSRLRDLPGTLRDGLFASSLTFLTYVLLQGIEGTLLRPFQILLAVGLAQGVTAPFLAPWQHRHPVLLATGAGLAFLAAFPHRLLSFPVLRTTFLVVLGTIATSSLAEVLAGDRTLLGERLGKVSLPIRYLLTFVSTTALWYLCFLGQSPGWNFSWRELEFFALLGLVSAAAAGPALERGRIEFRRKLLASLPDQCPESSSEGHLAAQAPSGKPVGREQEELHG